MAISGKIADGVIKIALGGYEAAKAQLVQLGAMAKKAGEGLSTIGSASTRGFAVATASITGFLKAADPVRFEIFTQKLQVLGMYIGLSFIPILDDAIAVIDKLTAFFKNLTDEQRETILHWTKIGLAVAAAGTALGAIVAILPKLIGLMRAVQVVIGLLLSETGIGLVLALVGAAVAVLELTGGMDKLRPMIDNIIKAFSGLASTGLTPVMNVLQKVGETFTKVFNKVVAVLTPIFAKIAKTFSDVVESFGPLIDQVGELFSGLVTDLAPVIAEVGQVFANLAKQVAPLFVQLGKQFMDVGRQLIGTVAQLLPSLLQLSVMFIKLWVTYQATLAVLLATLVGLFVKVWAAYQSTMMKLFAAFLKAVEVAIPPLIEIVNVLMETFMELLPVIMDIINVVGELVSVLIDVAGEILKLAVDVLGELLKALAECFKAFWKAFGPDIISFIKGVVSVIKDALEMVKRMVSAAKELAETVKSLNPFGSGDQGTGDTGEGDFSGEGVTAGDHGGAMDFGGSDEPAGVFGGGGLGRLVGSVLKGSKDATKTAEKSNKFAPMAPVQKVEQYGLEEAFKKAQQGAAFDPSKIAENERKKLMQEGNNHLAKIEDYVKPEKGALSIV